ncbi:hypothetical protein HF086_018386 [Spodoptera exigua]|uniref:Gustatory receptor n=1 Tax=Spodoptera exigua TaxID=7107 RepID=A0A922SK42_SPOEX|nr:hypothetical protein HF086_018386 [Spodoptera exigua]
MILLPMMILPHFWKTSKAKNSEVIIRATPTVSCGEVLLYNVVDKEFQSALRPLALMQRLFICAKFSIRDNFIASNTATYNYIGLSCALIFRSFMLYYLISTINQMIGITSLLSLCDIDDFIFFSVGFIINYYSNIIQCNNNVFLILKLQNVIRSLQIDVKVMKFFVITNWCYIIALNCVFILSNTYYCMFHVVGNAWDHLSSFTSITFDINIVYASFILSLLRRLVISWIEEFQSNGDSNNECYWNAMFDLYVNILEAYKLLKITSSLQVVYYTIHTVCHGLMTEVILLQMRHIIPETQVKFTMFAMLSQMWLVKNVALQIVLCVKSERFYAAMEQVPSVCVELMQTRGCTALMKLVGPLFTDKQRQVCKNIQRLHETSFKKMSGFGLFVVDVALPLRIASVLTSYTLAILQFALS